MTTRPQSIWTGSGLTPRVAYRRVGAGKVWEDHGRWKTQCPYSSSGDTWIGFCKLCKVSECRLAGRTDTEIIEIARGDA